MQKIILIAALIAAAFTTNAQAVVKTTNCQGKTIFIFQQVGDFTYLYGPGEELKPGTYYLQMAVIGQDEEVWVENYNKDGGRIATQAVLGWQHNGRKVKLNIGDGEVWNLYLVKLKHTTADGRGD